MSKFSRNWDAIKRDIQKKMYDAIDEATEKSFKDLQENVDYFYSAPGNPPPGNPPPGYARTGQLQDSPQLDGINHNGDKVVSQISINTSTQYDPAGRDTATIYGYAEDDGLRGYGGFWRETEYEIRENIQEAFGKRFE